MKRLTVLGLLLWSLTLGTARAVPLIELAGPVAAVEQGSSFEVAIRFSNLPEPDAPALKSYALELAFDAARFAPVSVAFGDSLAGNQLDVGGLGTVQTDLRGSAWFVGEESLSLEDDLISLQLDEFVLAVLTFQATAAGAGDIGIVLSTLGFVPSDPGAPLLGPTARITVIEPVVLPMPEPASALLIALGLAGLGVVRRRRLGA